MPDVLPEPSLYSQVLADCASATRHDGWTRETKVTFCEVLAITGRVVEALDAVNRSGNTAYAQRRRDPLFAKAWEMALAEARHRLADALLTRALDGTHVVQLDSAGDVVAERHVFDNRLALAVLRRLDRIADEQARAAQRPTDEASSAQAAVQAPATFDDALALLAAAPETARPTETHETHTLRDQWIGGEIRPPLRDKAPLGVEGAKRELCLSAMS
jgi:hypothetical protein